MKKIILSAGIAMLATVSIAQNFTAVYTFDSVKTTSGLIDPTPVPTETGVVFGSFSSIGTPANPSATKNFSFKNWPTGAVNSDSLYSQLTGSLSATEYYEVTLSPANGYTLSLSSITFGVQRSSTGIRTYVVRSSVDGFISNLPASIDPANTKLNVETGNVFFWNKDAITTNQNGSTITLNDINFSVLSGPVTFRFYGYNTEGNTGTFGIDNVTFTGIANAITTGISTADKSVKENSIIYPNPSANGVFTIDPGIIYGKTSISIYTMIGKLIFTKELNATVNITVDLSDEPNGSYFLAIKNGRSNSTQKIIISK